MGDRLFPAARGLVGDFRDFIPSPVIVTLDRHPYLVTNFEQAA
jgi:hypothetical protein